MHKHSCLKLLALFCVAGAPAMSVHAQSGSSNPSRLYAVGAPVGPRTQIIAPKTLSGSLRHMTDREAMAPALDRKLVAPAASLPHYDIDAELDVQNKIVRVHQRVQWTNSASVPLREIVFNAHAHYSIPDHDVGTLAKIIEVLRMSPREALSFEGPALQVVGVRRSTPATHNPDAAGWAKGGFGQRPGSAVQGQRPFLRLVQGVFGCSKPDATLTAVVKDQSAPPEDGAKAPPVDTFKVTSDNRESRAQKFEYAADNATALVVLLDEELQPGQTVRLDLDLVYRLPAKKGRWGHWQAVTMFAQAIPVLAVLEGNCWKPAPFIPWHQPFYNEAGLYTVRLRAPCDQKIGASAAEREVVDHCDGWRTIVYEPATLRDFSFVASSRFRECHGESEGVKIRCLYLPGHDEMGKTLVDAAGEAMATYSQWMGPYPYPQFTIVEAYFGWNGNECGGMVMIDDRMMSMPKLARNYPIYLIQHELCHQWWYNVVGTNGYAETWMDEGLATYLSHRLANETLGKNNRVIQWPAWLDWLPNIRREDLRNYGLVGARARGDIHPTVQEMEKYSHLPNLLAATYDRGGKVVGMIEERMGPDAFLDFLRRLYASYQFRILRVADFKRELEAYTGQSWQEFFDHWVYGASMCDWSLQAVEVEDDLPVFGRILRAKQTRPVRVTLRLKQLGDCNEPTVVGIRYAGCEGYQLRIPVYPDMDVQEHDDIAARVECVSGPHPRKRNCRTCDVKITVMLPSAPTQVTVDPDGILLDERPTNNQWKATPTWHLMPLYTQLSDADVTNAYDRWNINVGPWVFMTSYTDPWFARGTMAGFRVGGYRTQEFVGGLYTAYRSDDRSLIAGVDALWDHAPLPRTQVGFLFERSLTTLDQASLEYGRGVVFGRYVLMYGSSLYLPPFEYIEAFGVVQDRSLALPRVSQPDAEPFQRRTAMGLHYHKYLMTPYWDAEGGMSLDVTYQYGLPVFGNKSEFHLLYGQMAIVKNMPKLADWMDEDPRLSWFTGSRLAFRVAGATSSPSNGQFFALGGGDHFRGFDVRERQGNMTWLGSVEWRVPVVQNLELDFVDHFIGIRNIYLAPFYDVGNAYLKGQAVGPVAHAVGAGFRVDIAWLGLIERTMFRFDFAQTVNARTPTQFWFAIQHPF